MIDKEQIKHVASLAKLEFSDEEFDEFAEKFQETIKMEDMLTHIDTKGVEPTTNLSTRTTTFREDVAQKEQSRELLMKNVPEEKDGLIKVPSILDTEGDN
ncbi:aspartyl/glutamyl-tRNA(Asn/Gln) amidotransferase subunit C [Companilactobacillus sp. RD055328]|uniref:Asp-tRNA(Asn)/Glu-tRNA(Gln) amidotransferase subunit GatC n=1 Tax=Companilactobacillus sp. RD055328 TaxID=2916634 RepID=UPI001FC8067D|nr:Asp-tRNA(Asn)/Glu-tRNA(Gln) amidotransferase subunit GatC [Companilactobacillus sp. RD055328]GKQ43129.1 aspartyl/glutamyl-tRNA(Asn/Gln) amidotransferase subunit C [Companilactobacillus sp. RD055328]